MPAIFSPRSSITIAVLNVSDHRDVHGRIRVAVDFVIGNTELHRKCLNFRELHLRHLLRSNFNLPAAQNWRAAASRLHRLALRSNIFSS
jgi:hypothetical protein